MARYALVRDGMVENVISWDGISPWEPPSGFELVLDEHGEAEPEGRFNGRIFLARIKPTEPPPEKTVGERFVELEAKLTERAAVLEIENADMKKRLSAIESTRVDDPKGQDVEPKEVVA
jgi:hypothetical protein